MGNIIDVGLSEVRALPLGIAVRVNWPLKSLRHINALLWPTTALLLPYNRNLPAYKLAPLEYNGALLWHITALF